ncbi:extracellular solute-binding protein [Paenibacillus sp. FSL L8-0333]|uniref:ABC transporter substrate-binding protein n=1 Tax=unclassified Paenibacillus TaxID=185978 RepID=UPI0030D33B84
MKKTITTVALLAMMTASLTGCGGNNNNNGNTTTPSETNGEAVSTTTPSDAPEDISGTITYLSNRTDLIGNTYDEYAKRFNEKYPNAHVEFEAITDYDKTAKVRLSSGEYPDVMNIPTISNTELANFYAPLDDLGLNDRIRFKEHKSFEGKVYGIPSSVDAVGIVYSKKTFKAAGITEVPKTLDEFYAAAEKLKDKGIVALASNFKDQWPLYPFAQETPVAISGNANFYNDRVNTDTPYTMDGPFGQSMSIIRTMYEKGYLEPDVNSSNWEQSKKDIADGKVGMYYLGEWIIDQLITGTGMPSDDVGFFPFPYDNDLSTNNVLLQPGSNSYGVNKNSAHIATAKAFVKWMIEESGDDKNVFPILKDKEPELAQIKEFESYNPTYIEGMSDSVDAVSITNKAQITKEAIVQEFILNENPQDVFDKYNSLWAKAKKAVLQ